MGTLISKVKELFTSVKEDKTKSNFVGMFVLGVVNIATSLILKYVIGFKFSLLTGISDLFSTLFGTGTTQSTQEEDLTDKFDVRVLYDSRKKHATADILVLKKPENWSVNKLKWVEVHDETETPAENTEITYITSEDPAWGPARYEMDVAGVGEVLGVVRFEVEPVVVFAKDYQVVFKHNDSEREYAVSFTLPFAPDASEFEIGFRKLKITVVNVFFRAKRKPDHWNIEKLKWIVVEDGVEIERERTVTNDDLFGYDYNIVVDNNAKQYRVVFIENNLQRRYTVPVNDETAGEFEGEGNFEGEGEVNVTPGTVPV